MGFLIQDLSLMILALCYLTFLTVQTNLLFYPVTSR